ncbi:MAG: response regulator transcription factor [Betaproteobacteria bacterium]
MTTRHPDDAATLLIVDDDATLCDVLARALTTRGFAVTVAHSAEDALAAVLRDPPEFAVVDLRLPDRSGLKLVTALKEADAHTRIVVLTGHASIPTAVEAIKLGATNYLTKPADADTVVAALRRDEGDDSLPIDEKAMTVERVEWEHIQHVLHQHDGNISATARALSMHRRTLQRKLQKRPVTA